METKQKQLIQNKIEIPGSPVRMRRPRLLNALRDNLASYTATIVNGRAGSGKTTIVADFARLSGRPVAWYKVDAADSNLGEFMAYLLESICHQRKPIDHAGLLKLAESTSTTDRAEALAEVLVFQLAEFKSEPLLIVIEDLHLIYDADWVVPFFHRLLPLLPADVHVVITCRSMPPTPLWRLRSKQMLRVVNEDELAFTMDEAIRLFEQYDLSEDYARVAMRQTNGRASAIAAIAATPGRAGRAKADEFLAITPLSLAGRTPDFQT